jgi:hypothetical protein
MIAGDAGIDERFAELTHPELGRPVKVYRYLDEAHRLLFVVCRFEPKDFRQARLVGSRWRWDLNGTPRVLYRLPRLQAALATGETIYIVEGEKDVEAIEAAGGVATCNPQGAGKWTDELSEQLQGARRVRIVVDRDPDEKRGADRFTPGERHAREIVESLGRVAGVASCEIELVQAVGGKDAADHLGAGHTLDEFELFEPSLDIPPVAADPETTDPASFAARVAATRVDLLERISLGIPPIDYLPASDGMLVRGKRHLLAAPKKQGKTISKLVHWTTMACAGARVVILDRENGANLYAGRLEAIIAALNLDGDARNRLAQNLVYHEFPRLRVHDGDELVSMCAGADVVVFDSQRMFLTDFGLGEDASDDYAKFVGAAIDPLFRAGIATVILDNTGHEETKRSRGSSAKGDLNEVLFTLEVVEPFDLDMTGRVRLEITDSRFGNAGRWEMAIGGGVFEPWRSVSRDDGESGPGDWKPTALMERVSRHLERQTEPVSRNEITRSVSGKRTYLLAAIDCLITEGCATETVGARGAKLVAFAQRFPVPDQFPAVPGNGTEALVPDSPLSTRGNQ